jgi:hypothetical protein
MKLQEPFKIVVYGLGKFAEYVAFVINEDTECEVVAYTVEREHLPDGNGPRDLFIFVMKYIKIRLAAAMQMN